jgi:hypothetical protein
MRTVAVVPRVVIPSAGWSIVAGCRSRTWNASRWRWIGWVLLTESPEGGWGIGGHANTNADIAAAARAALAGQ